jgi:hypothetical protein
MVGYIDRAAFQFPNSTFAQEANGFEDFVEPEHQNARDGGGAGCHDTISPWRPVGGGAFSLDIPFHRTTPPASDCVLAGTPPNLGGEVPFFKLSEGCALV